MDCCGFCIEWGICGLLWVLYRVGDLWTAVGSVQSGGFDERLPLKKDFAS